MKARKVLSAAMLLMVLGASLWTIPAVLADLTVATYSSAGGAGASLTGTNVFTGSNTFTDSLFKICDNGDATKCFQVENSGITTGNTITPFTFTGTTTLNLMLVGSGAVVLGNQVAASTTSNDFVLWNGAKLGWSSASSANGASTADTYFTRLAATVIKPNLWVQNGGRSSLAADFTNATTTLNNTALSVTVISGRKYTFKAVLFVSDSLAADGGKFDYNGGTATSTDFRVHCTLFDTALLLSTQATALATAFSQATITGSGMFECYGSFEPSGNGTFIIRAAQTAHTTGTLTVFRGSNLWVEDMP